MIEYAHVAGEDVGQVERLAAPLPDDHPKLVSGALRPVVDEDDFDATLHILTGGTTLVLEADRVRRARNYRLMTEAEVAAALAEMIAAKDRDIQLEFERRCDLPIDFEVDGVVYPFHADREARENIMGVVLLIGTGVPVPDPREWTPYGHTEPVSITHAELVGLGAAIAARKDALFTAKKQKQADVAALTTAAQVAAFDITEGWPE